MYNVSALRFDVLSAEEIEERELRKSEIAQAVEEGLVAIGAPIEDIDEKCIAQITAQAPTYTEVLNELLSFTLCQIEELPKEADVLYAIAVDGFFEGEVVALNMRYEYRIDKRNINDEHLRRLED